MAISFVQQRESHTTVNATSIALAYSGAVGTGNLLTACVLVSNGFAGPITVTVSDSVNGSWSAAGSVQNDNTNDGCQMQFFYFPNTASGTPTVTASASTAQQWVLFLLEYSGIVTSTPVDATNKSGPNASSTSGSTANITTTNANDLILAALGSTNSGGGDDFSGIATSGVYTRRSSDGSGTGGGAVSEQIVGSSGTITGAAYTWTFSNPFITSIVAFKAPAAASQPYEDDTFNQHLNTATTILQVEPLISVW